MIKTLIQIIVFSTMMANLYGQVVQVGSGSYTTKFPGVDAAGRNAFPSGTPFTIGKAATVPTPTNDWWSHKVKNNHSPNLFNYPFTLKTANDGLVVSYIPWGPIDDILPVVVGVTDLNAAAANVSDFSDWTVTMDWSNANKKFTTTAGIGMPFLYFTKATNDVAQIKVNQGTVTIVNEMMVIENIRNGADFAVYAPIGSTWQKSGNVYTSTLNGKNYWSLGFIPLTATNINATANSYKKYAYVFPTNTKTTWSYDKSTSVVTTDFKVDVDVKEGKDSTMLLGLLPHHWDNLASGAPSFTSNTYATVRGQLKTIESNTFRVQNTFYGILPTLPYVDLNSPSFNPSELNTKIKLLENDALNTWTDSYNEGQEMNRLIQTARIAQLTGENIALEKIVKTIKNRLENWLTNNNNEVAFLFYYNKTWSAMLGFPAGHGQDSNLNDHHFHWGYFIHAACFLEQFEPGWAAKWGGMINLLVRDAASQDRKDNLFPFLRNFSPYAGHCWANGFASFPQGNDQESTSESMQFNSSLIHWGAVTGNDSIRDLGIYLYTTEQSAVEEYWFDQNNRNFGPNQNYSLVSRVWGNSYDNGTFWTNDITASYGIELYPIHGGSLYLGHDDTYVKQLWDEIEKNTGILTNDPNVNLWHDIMWQYLAFIDPAKAISLYDSYPDRNLKFGVSDAQTYHWLHAMNVLGKVDVSITSNHPLAAVFNNNGDITYVAQNYGKDSISVLFSTGYVLPVPPNTLVTSKDINIRGVLTSSFAEAYAGGSVALKVNVSNGTPSKIDFYDGEKYLGTTTNQPFTYTASNLTIGKHAFSARVYEADKYNITNIVTVTVGEQLPYSGSPIVLPGTFQSAQFDVFEGGVGNGIAYQDLSVKNEGNFRLNEYVDAQSHPTEGNYVGWILPGEWLEYTVDVQQAGFYTINMRYASGNTAGGGPINFESDGIVIKSGVTVTSSGNWNTWATKSITNVPLKSGKQILRIYFEKGELNLGKLTFVYNSPLNYSQPIANAGNNQILIIPQNTTQLDGSESTNPGGGALSYTWTQVYGPSTLQFSNINDAKSSIDNIVEGVYLLRLKVDNGNYTDEDEVYIIAGKTNNVAPKVSISTPLANETYIEGELISISANASDLNDNVVKLDLYVDNIKIGSSVQSPYTKNWEPNPGSYKLKAIAYDTFGDSTISAEVAITISPAPSCEGKSWNGDFNYKFSDADVNPTITFIPSNPNVGSPTCILYYGTDSGTLPGYIVQPNVPYQINAVKGSKIFFYYTYSYPGAGERNNSANKNNYVVGSCKNLTSTESTEKLSVRHYPNPVSDFLTLDLPEGDTKIEVYNANGALIQVIPTKSNSLQLDMRNYVPGLYLIKLTSTSGFANLKIIKI